MSTGTTVKTVSIFVESRIVAEDEGGLNLGFYPVPAIITVLGIGYILRSGILSKK